MYRQLQVRQRNGRSSNNGKTYLSIIPHRRDLRMLVLWHSVQYLFREKRNTPFPPDVVLAVVALKGVGRLGLQNRCPGQVSPRRIKPLYNLIHMGKRGSGLKVLKENRSGGGWSFRNPSAG